MAIFLCMYLQEWKKCSNFAVETRKNIQMSSKITKHTAPQNSELARSESFKLLLSDVRQIIENGLQQAYHSVNQTMLHTYWNVGKRIIEDEQHGNRRAEYGKQQIKHLAGELVPQYGSSYNERNLYQFRNFYLTFSNL